MKDDRRKQMAAYIAKHQTVTMAELCNEFKVSINTVRTDVATLTKTGVVEKVYGGVCSTMQQAVPMFTQRTRIHPDSKFSIARAAVEQINDGDTLFIDAGTTTMHMMGLLPMERHVTIITANLHIISQAYTHPNAEIIVLPGAVNRRTNSMADITTLEFLGRCHFAKAFVATTGLSKDGSLNVKTFLEYEIKRLAIAQSDTKYLLCDFSKFGSSILMIYAKLTDIDKLITDERCPEELRELCAAADTELIIAR